MMYLLIGTAGFVLGVILVLKGSIVLLFGVGVFCLAIIIGAAVGLAGYLVIVFLMGCLGWGTTGIPY